jgi:hypothetical protein
MLGKHSTTELSLQPHTGTSICINVLPDFISVVINTCQKYISHIFYNKNKKEYIPKYTNENILFNLRGKGE